MCPLILIAFLSIANVHLIFASDKAGASASSLKDLCSVPSNFAPENPAAKRVRLVDASDRSQVFLSKDAPTSIPAICMGNGTAFRVELEEPSEDDEAMKAAREAIGETSPEVVENAKRELVALLKNDTKLNAPLDNDAWLVRFLRLKKYNVPETFKFIKYYYNYKARNQNIFGGLLPSKEQKAAETEAVGLLPKRDPAGRRIVVLQARNWNPRKISLIEVWRVAALLAEVGAYEPRTQLAGVQIIIDVGGLTMEQVRQFNPSLIITWLTRVAPFRYEGFHILRQPRIFSILFNMFKPFFTKDMRSKIFFHGESMESLHRHIPASHLPECLGGSYAKPGFSSYEWGVILKSLDPEFTALDSYGVKNKN